MTYLSSELLKALFAAVFALSLLSGIWLVSLRNLKRWPNYLASLLLIICLPSGLLYCTLAFPDLALQLLPLQMLMIWLYGPWLIWGIAQVLHIQPKPLWRSLSYVPVSSALAFTLHSLLRNTSLPHWWSLVSCLQALAFIAISFYWLTRYKRQLVLLHDHFRSTSLYRLLWLCAALLWLMTSDLVIHSCNLLHLTLDKGTLFSLVTPPLLALLVAAAWTAQHLLLPEDKHWQDLSPINSGADANSSNSKKPPADDLDADTRHNSNRQLPAATAKQLLRKLDELIHQQKIHLRNDLTQQDLARELGISPQLTSELLSQHYRTSFYELLNRHRLSESKRLLENPKSFHSIVDVAYESGFNNLDSFYREFKQALGCTPAQYRRLYQTK